MTKKQPDKSSHNHDLDNQLRELFNDIREKEKKNIPDEKEFVNLVSVWLKEYKNSSRPHNSIFSGFLSDWRRYLRMHSSFAAIAGALVITGIAIPVYFQNRPLEKELLFDQYSSRTDHSESTVIADNDLKAKKYANEAIPKLSGEDSTTTGGLSPSRAKSSNNELSGPSPAQSHDFSSPAPVAPRESDDFAEMTEIQSPSTESVLSELASGASVIKEESEEKIDSEKASSAKKSVRRSFVPEKKSDRDILTREQQKDLLEELDKTTNITRKIEILKKLLNHYKATENTGAVKETELRLKNLK